VHKIISVGGQEIEVAKKDIKNIYLRVRSSEGRIVVSAPKHISDETIRLFILSKQEWIENRSQTLQQHSLLSPQEYLEGEHYYVWGRQYALSLLEKNSGPKVELLDGIMQITVKPNASHEYKEQLVNAWCREQLRMQATPLIEQWCSTLGVSIHKLYVRKMKRYWGSCNTHKETIRLNSELVKKPIECLEYVLVHELVHLLEPSHNKNFHALMTTFLPDWKKRKKLLNSFPLATSDTAV